MDGSAKKSARRLMVDISDHGQTKVTASADALLPATWKTLANHRNKVAHTCLQ
jgi:hypothetical protein